MTRLKNKYDIAKVITLVLVVFAHSTKMFTSEAAISRFDSNSILSVLTSFVYSFHMPVFIALSGSVYAICMKKGKYDDFVGFAKKKAKRLLLPYAFFSIVVVAPVLSICDLTVGNYFIYFAKNFILCLDNRHLWYVIVLFFIFIIMSIISSRLESHKKMIIIVFSVLALLPYFPFLNYLKINKTLHMLLYFYIGYLLVGSKCLCFDEKNNNLICFILGLFCTICFWFISYKIQGLTYMEKVIIIIIKQCTAISGIIMIYGIAHVLFESRRLDGKIVGHILKNSYGIYLFHPMIIYLLVYFLPKRLNIFITCSMLFIISFILADLFTEIMRLLKLQMFIGEGNIKKHRIE